MAESDRLVDDLLVAQDALMRTMQAQAAPDWLDLDLSMAQLKALLVLEQIGPATIGRVSRALGTGAPASSHLIDRLVQAGLVDRWEDPRDRRRMLATLSPGGADQIRALRTGRENQMRAWFDRMEPAALTALLTGLRALERAVRSAAGDVD